MFTSCDTLDVVRKTSVYPKINNLLVCAIEAIEDNGAYQVNTSTVRYGVSFTVSDKKNMSFRVSLNENLKTPKDQKSETDILQMTVMQGPAHRMDCDGAENYKVFMQDVENIIQQHCAIKSIESDFDVSCK